MGLEVELSLEEAGEEDLLVQHGDLLLGGLGHEGLVLLAGDHEGVPRGRLRHRLQPLSAGTSDDF